MKITTIYGRDINENIFICYIFKNFNVNDMNYFQASKFIDIIRIIGENVNPVKFSDIKDKNCLYYYKLSRKLIWLQNLKEENLFN